MMLSSAKRYAKWGLAAHWLRRKSKAPVAKEWSTLPVNTESDLNDDYQDGYNVGVRLGTPSFVCGYYALVLDVDVKGDEHDAKEAFAELDDMLPGWRDLPYVRSGGKRGQHVYFFCAEAFPSKKLRRSNRKVEWTDKAGKKHKSWAWEIELFGTGKQVAAPPSVHPETGNTYEWGRELDLDHIGDAVLNASLVQDWCEWVGGGDKEAKDDVPADDLLDLTRRKPIGITESQAWSYLEDLPFDAWCFDYEGWLKVGMALHHEFGEDGLELWHDFSKRADNYDPDVLDGKWRSFNASKQKRPVRFATLIHAGAPNRFKRLVAGADSVDDLDENDDWLRELDMDKQERPESHLDNVTLLVEHDPRVKGILAYNQFTQGAVLIEEPDIKMAKSKKRQGRFRQIEGPLWTIDPTQEREGRPLEDSHTNNIRLAFEAPARRGGYGIKISDRDLNSALDIVTRRNSFHPVVSYLESLDEWDGIERVDRLFIDWLGSPDTPYHRTIARLFLIAAIARVYSPGLKFDFAPIIEGPQGTGKSTFIRILARYWFVELDASFDDNKALVEQLRSAWIAELPELSQFGKTEVEKIKAFFSKREDKVRLSYRRNEQVFKRQSVYMGTTNNDEYLRDETGGRRFWPVESKATLIDNPAFEKVVDEVWAEALMLYRQMVKKHGSERLPLFLADEAETEALSLQESRRVETEADTWRGQIEKWLNTPVRRSVLEGKGQEFDDLEGKDPLVLRNLACGLEIWIEVLGGVKKDYARGNQLQMSKALRKIPGWESVKGLIVHGSYGKQRCIRRVAPSNVIYLPPANRSINSLIG